MRIHFAHLVHVNEGVEVDRVDAGEGPTDGKTFALVSLGCVGHRLDGAQVDAGSTLRRGRVMVSAVTAGISSVSDSLRFNYSAGK